MRARNVTTLQAVLFAWGITDYQLVGIPAWARSERFEINFTAIASIWSAMRKLKNCRFTR